MYEGMDLMSGISKETNTHKDPSPLRTIPLVGWIADSAAQLTGPCGASLGEPRTPVAVAKVSTPMLGE
jgi:hypothetical protein